MLKKTWIIAAVTSVTLAGCLNTVGERAVVGASAGVIAADVLGTDRTGTALVGAAAGAFCDAVGRCD